MFESQNTTTLHINDPAFYPGKVTAYSNGDVVKEDIPSDVVTVGGRKVEKAKTKSQLLDIKELWVDFKFWLKKVGIKLGIMPRVSPKTHFMLYPAFQVQRDELNPVLKELKSNPPKLNAVKGFSLQDIENRREAEFNERMREALKDRELRPLLTSVKQVAKQTAAKEKRDAHIDNKKAANAKRHVLVLENKARIKQEAELKLNEDKLAHEQKMKRAEKNREDKLTVKKEKAMAANKHAEEVRARAAAIKAADKTYGPDDARAFEIQMLHDQTRRQAEVIELLKEKVRAAEKPFTTQSHTVTTV